MGNSNRRDSDDGFTPPQLVDNTENLTPLKKLRDQLKICDKKPRRRLAVLVATGSYCPIHKMHVEVFESAKKHLEEEYNYYVVGGFLSPSHHFHVYAKVGDFAIPIEDRVKMAQLAVKDSNWIEVSSWEGSQPFFVDLGAVTRQINEFIVQKIEEKYTNELTVFYLCGADLAVRCGFHNRNGKRPMRFVGVCRPGYGEQLRQEWKEYMEKNPLPANDANKMDIDEGHGSQPNNSNINNTPERHFILIESETEDFSSTAVRDCIVGGKFAEMEKMLDVNVAEYIRAKNYFDYAEILKSTDDPRFRQ